LAKTLAAYCIVTARVSVTAIYCSHRCLPHLGKISLTVPGVVWSNPRAILLQQHTALVFRSPRCVSLTTNLHK